MARHNELCDEVADLAGRDFTPAHMRDNPKIFTGCAVHVGKAKSKAKVKGVPPPDGGGSPNPVPMDAGDGQYSRNVCFEY